LLPLPCFQHIHYFWPNCCCKQSVFAIYHNLMCNRILNHIWFHVHTTIIGRWVIARIIPRTWCNWSNKRISKITLLVMRTFSLLMSWWCFFALSTYWLISSLPCSSLAVIFG
jgi:hypothetical protein